MRLLLTGGGSGGHVYPALAVAEALAGDANGRHEPLELLYVGSEGGMEAAVVAQADLPYQSIPAAPLRGRSPRQVVLASVTLGRGVLRVLRLLDRWRPDAILATGGYVSGPVVFAGWLRRVPALLYLPDIRPGWAISLLARLATRVAVTSELSSRYLSMPLVATGYPVRQAFWTTAKVEARHQLGLEPSLPTLLVLGGSQGAQSINRGLALSLTRLLSLCQVIHIAGSHDRDWLEGLREELAPDLRRRYRVTAYLHEELPLAFAAADLAVSRAGASVFGELPASGLPAVLVPYPYAGSHQEINARVMVEAGAAVQLPDGELHRLGDLVEALLADESRLRAMAERARALADRESAHRLAGLLTSLARSPQRAGP